MPRAKTIALRVTPSEHRFVFAEAKKFGCSSSALIRVLIKLHYQSRQNKGEFAQRVEEHVAAVTASERKVREINKLETPHD